MKSKGFSEGKEGPEKSLLEYALSYARLGWSVFPIRPKEKKPLVKWEKFQKEKATDDQIKRWWKKWPNANIGLATGFTSDLIVIDIDSEKGRENYIAAFNEIQNTISQTTGKPKALHLLFKHPREQKYQNMADNFLKDVHVRGDGGYIIIAPSIHPNGTQYKWTIDPTEMGLDDLMDLPEEVKAKLNAQKTAEGTLKNPAGWVQEALMGVKKGSRNEMCTKLAGYYLRVFNGDIEQTEIILESWNERNEPPLDWKEVRRTIKSVNDKDIKNDNNQVDLKSAMKAIGKIKDAPDPEKAVIEAMESPETLGELALVADQNRGVYEATLDRLRKAGVLARSIDGLKRSVNSERKHRKANKLRIVQPGEGAEPRIAGDMVNDCPVPKLIIPQPYILNSKETVEMQKFSQVIVPRTIAHAPILITHRFRDAEEGDEYLRIAWIRPSGWLYMIVDRGVALDGKRLVGLASKGVPVAGDNSAQIGKYLHELEAANLEQLPSGLITSHMGWQGKDGKRGFMWGRKLICPDGETILEVNIDDISPEGWKENYIAFRGLASGDEQIAKGFHSRGTIEVWQEIIKPLEIFPKVLVCLYASFIPPLLSILKAPNFVIDLANRTSTGKTTALRISASVWGLPDEKGDGALGSWDATKVWLERASGVMDGFPLILDDTKRAKRPEMVSDIIYLVSQGRGRGRGNIKSLERTRTWHTVLISSGEATATSFTQDGGSRARCLEIRGIPFGKDDSPTRRLVDQLNNKLMLNYGHAGPAFIRWLLSHRDEWPKFEAKYRKAVEFYADKATTAEGGRLAQYFAALHMAEVLAHAAGVLPWEYAERIKGIWPEIAAEAEEAPAEKRALRDMISWAYSNEQRFFGRHQEDTPGTPRPIFRGWAGRWEKEDWEYIAFFPTVLKEQLTAQAYEHEAIFAGWKERGWLDTEKSKNRYTKKVRIDKNSVRMVVITRKAIVEAEA